jgi:hypothetical protein
MGGQASQALTKPSPMRDDGDQIMKAKKTLLWGLLVLAPVAARGESCRDWNEVSESWRGGYVVGFTEGLASPGASDARFRG